MKDALNGTNHATLLATISPSSQCYEETLATLRFAEHLCLLGKPTQVFPSTKSYTSSLLGNEKNLQVNFFLLEINKINSAVNKRVLSSPC
jgi:hypothetical protein